MTVPKHYRVEGGEPRRGHEVAVALARSGFEADLIVGRLRSGGVAAMRGARDPRGYARVVDDNSIYVLEDDLEMARHILAEAVEL